MSDPTISSTPFIVKTASPRANRGAQFFDSISKAPPKNSAPVEQRGFYQASQSLPTNAKPRTDVPRGYYLNIIV
jgi:hypothetical protein